jgi:exopolysaccharide biosynthesis polyprenyl glycosylphosphotransferase
VRKEPLLAALDLGAAAGSISLALLLRFPGGIPHEHLIPYLTCLPLLLAWRLFMAQCFGLYDFRHRLTMTDHFFGACGAALFGVAGGYVALALVLLYYAPLTQLSRLTALLDLGVLAVWFTVSRALVLAWLTQTGYRVRVLLIGPVQGCRALAEELRAHAPRLVDVAGIAANGEPGDVGEVLGRVTDVAKILAEHGIHQAILAEEDMPQDGLRDLLAHCDREAVELFAYPDIGLTLLANTRVTSIGGVPLVSLCTTFPARPYAIGKRVLDAGAALAGLVLLWPVCLAAALAVKAGSRGPALFVQERVGCNGKPFRMVKFRTMVDGAEADSGAVLSMNDDPRVTSVGRVLRRFRIDEIPQLWNVLRGDMSLVGPRPERRVFVDAFLQENPLYERRLLVKPGLTGLAQIQGRYDTGYTHKLRYDLIYINGMSLATDLRILLATVRTVLTGRGAA